MSDLAMRPLRDLLEAHRAVLLDANLSTRVAESPASTPSTLRTSIS
jgi:hypothetical protein